MKTTEFCQSPLYEKGLPHSRTDGKRHNLQLMLGPTNASTDQQSWGKYTPKTRVLTVFLHITAYTIDNGDTHPLQLKLTYTGTPITDC